MKIIITNRLIVCYKNRKKQFNIAFLIKSSETYKILGKILKISKFNIMTLLKSLIIKLLLIICYYLIHK